MVRRYGIMHLISFSMLLMGGIISLSSLSMMGNWFGLEVMNFSFFFFFFLMDNRGLLLSLMMYFWLSGVTGFSLLFGYLLMSTMVGVGSIIFFMALLLKFGCFPFMGWVLFLYKYLDFFTLFMLSSVMKFPLFMFLDFIGMKVVLFALMMGLVSILISMVGSMEIDLKLILAFSTIGVLGDLLFFYFFGFDFFVMMFSFYSVVLGLVILVSFISVNWSMSMGDSLGMPVGGMFMMFFFMLFGLPPFISFFLKIYFFYTISMSGMFSWLIVFLYFFFLVFMGVNYYRVFIMADFITEVSSSMMMSVKSFSVEEVVGLLYIFSIFLFFGNFIM
uniref:NADH dehydrogenase subunit 2 n=1 Tax=Setaphyes kielensis TaxID=3298910 RepID=A0A1I9VTT3_9BILA|nr:NADH dehydrogenase subunit 2 [Pycnophyes kielensis]APA17406.1 NADH dehydrogenase subunit 2 [Pycnophyes kielensis]